MPRKDAFHEIVKTALVKDGWIITHDPLILKFGEQDVKKQYGNAFDTGKCDDR